jgi:hypothetical protein
MKETLLQKSKSLPLLAPVIIAIAVVLLAVGLGALYKHAHRSTSENHTTVVTEGRSNHQNVVATVFWAGEPPDSDNHDITNVSSAWVDDWVGEFGGVDSPDNRSQWRPCAFAPKENTFYFALPFNDLNDQGDPKPTSVLRQIPWYPGRPAPDNQSLVKNHWIAVTKGSKTAYAQWEDVGPFYEDDQAYVFGTSAPKAHAGLDLSPATDDYIGGSGEDRVSWHFVDADKVPPGPWLATVTTSGVSH